MNYLYVSIGAAIGGVLRFGISKLIYKIFTNPFPTGTLVVNVVGSFLIGLIMFYLEPKEILTPGMRLLLTVGFCGGFTTFSTFSYETISLFRDSEIFLGSLNVLLNVFLCLIGVYLAYLLSKLV